MHACKLAELPDELLIAIFTEVCESKTAYAFRRRKRHPNSGLLLLSRRFLNAAREALYTAPEVRGEKGVTVFAQALSRDPAIAEFATSLAIICVLPFEEETYDRAKRAHLLCRHIESVLQRTCNLQELVLKDTPLADHVIRGCRHLSSLRFLVIAGLSEFTDRIGPRQCEDLLQCLAGLSLERFFWIPHREGEGEVSIFKNRLTQSS